MPQERLQKLLAHAGVASRRHAEQLIVEGRVTVNGAVITELGTKADPETDHIKVDGKRVGAQERLVYLAMNKPKDCMSTVMDPEGRATVMDLLRGVKARVYPVGRLDYASEGLLLLTNDGEFAKRITSAGQPRHEDLSGEDQWPALARPGREIPRRRSAQREEDRARRPEADPARAEPLVRSTINRRAAKSDSSHVQTFWAAGGKAQARENRLSGAGLAAARQSSGI